MDKSMLGDLDNLPEEDKARMSTMIDQLQIRDRVLFMFRNLEEFCPFFEISALSVGDGYKGGLLTHMGWYSLHLIPC
ncbi:hypothetical protein M5K25_006398 [Dendrobium thyrsiflorum]|uniref:Uncharacterized protein n=1 Tax=Dendrobium thyrsiflorum TaxID=117978 RepID=A0ABD0VBM3_DENTH